MGYFVKGSIYYKWSNNNKEQYNDSILYLEQAIKYDKEGKRGIKAILKLVKIKMKQKDFYGAFYTIQRGVNLHIPQEENKKFHTYLEMCEAVFSLR